MPALLFVQNQQLFVTVTQLLCSDVSNYLACNVCCNRQPGTIQEMPKKYKDTFASEGKILLL